MEEEGLKQRKIKKVDREQQGKEERKLRREKGLKKVEEPRPTSPLNTILKVLGLLALIPLVLSVPWFLSVGGGLLKDHVEYFYYLWAVYLVVQLFIFFYLKRTTLTWDSFITQNLTYGIFTLGAYTMVDIPRFLPVDLRQVALYLWCSFTMVFNIVFFIMDDTDYQEKERKEKLKEERRKKREEERKRKEKEQEEKENESKEPLLGPRAKLVVDLILYILYIVIAIYLAKLAYNYVYDLQEKIAFRHGTVSPEDPPNFDFDE